MALAISPELEFPLPLYASPQQFFNGQLPPTAGGLVRAWIEKNVVHGEGDSFGLPIRKSPQQRWVLDRMLEYHPVTKKLLYNRVLIGVGKGGSKTEDAADFGIAEVAGPIRPIRSPRVVVSAASFDNAQNVFRAAKDSIEAGPLDRFFHCFDRELYPKSGRGIMQRIAARGGTNDGKLPTCNVADELHEWLSEAQKKVYTVQAEAMHKRKVPRLQGLSGAILLSISTAGDDKESTLGEVYEHGIKVATGEIIDPGLLILWWEAPKLEGEDLDDPEQLRAAVLAANPACSSGGWLEPEQIEAAYYDPVTRRTFERYHLNRWVTSPKAWIAPDSWKERKPKERTGFPPDGTPIVLGFDGSYNRDTTALVGWTLPDAPDGWGDYGFLIASWEKENKDPDWTVPRSEVDAEVFKAIKRWKVVEMVADPPGWVTELEGWENEFGARTADDEGRVRGSGLVLRFETNQPARMGPACDRFRAAVLDPTSTLQHDGSPVIARHVKNCNTRDTRYGAVIVKDRKDSPHKIDLAVACVIARQRAMYQPKPRKPARVVGF